MIEFRTMRNEDIENWFDHCAIVFGNGENTPYWRDKFVNGWYDDPFSTTDGVFLAVEDGKILSSVSVFLREVYLEGDKISMGGIGSVSTKPEARGKGLAGRLLENTVTYMENKRIKISLLATNLIGYYKKFGWQQLFYDCKTLKYKKLNDSDIENGIPNIREMNFDTDTGAISEIYEAYSGKLNGVVVRQNINYWRKWVKSFPGTWLVLCDKTGKIYTYTSYTLDKNVITVREFGTLLPDIILF
jgi:predicted acetyltransferase